MNRFDPYENTSGPLDNYQDSLELNNDPLSNYSDPMTRVDPFADNPGLFNEIINWSHDPMNKPQNQNKYFFSDGKTYYEQICKMLKLMAVFKDAFNQIYDNEDEIHEAWENFVENLSATATAGDEASVTLVWTDESVQFQFVMPKGQKGDKGDQGDPGQDGVSITNIAFNADYTMTITLSNGNTYTSPSLKGEKGDPGEGLEILDIYTTLAELEQAHPTGQPGNAYLIGTDPNYTLYIWSTSQSDWLPAGSLTAPSPSTSTPLMDGTASTGSENAYSRGDHVHPTDTSRASASDLTALSGTVTTLSGDLTTLSGNVTTLSGTVTTLGTTVGTISGNVTQLQSDMTQAQGDITQLQGDVTDITGDVSQLQTDVGTLDDRVDTLSDDLTVLEEIVTGSNDLDNQQFLYRKAPTDHDTIARINSIKGNTVSFNQLVQNGNFADTSGWNANASPVFSVSNNIATVKGSTDYSGIYRPISLLQNHKYFVSETLRAEVNNYNFYSGIENLTTGNVKTLTTSFQTFNRIATFTGTNATKNFFFYDLNNTTRNNVYIKNIMCFDLTLMGIDNLTTVAEVKSWLFSHVGDLPYYDYTQGTLIPFMGTGLKTTGFNQFDELWESGALNNSTGAEEPNYNIDRFKNYIPILPDTDYYITYENVGYRIPLYFYDSNKTFISRIVYDSGTVFTTPSNACYLRGNIAKENGIPATNINISDPDKNGTYEPYTSNTLSLPTLTYFPTGMKDCSQSSPVYDEMNLTIGKGYEIVESVDLGTLNWLYDSANSRFKSNALTGSKNPSSTTEIPNAICPRYPVVSYGGLSADKSLTIIFESSGDKGQVWIKDTSYTSASDFKAAMSGVMLYFEKETPTEFDISLDSTYPVWNGGTEQILPVNGSTPDTAPIRADFSYMSTDEAIQYLYDHISASVQAELDDLDERVSDVETAIGSETTTPMSGILGRLNEDETTMSTIETYVQKLSNGVNLGSSTLRKATFRYDDYSLASNDYQQYDLNGTIPTGYIPIALMNVRTGNSNVVPVGTMIDYEYSSYFRLTVRNLSSSTQTGQIWVEILCIKTY